MNTTMSCDTVRDLFFELRQGRIEQAQREVFAEHLVGCRSCAEHVEKLDSMLDEALLWEPADEIAHKKDDLFAAIAAEIEDKPVQLRPAAAFAVDESLVDESGSGDKRRLPWMRIFVACAAVVVAALAWPLFMMEFFDGEGAAPANEVVASADVAERELPVFMRPDTLFAESASVSDSVRVLPAEHARWALEAGPQGWELVAYEGQVLVEFLPRRAGEELHFRFPGGEGQVVGTVFYLDADTSEVGVVTGGVEVTPEGEEKVLLTDRRAWRDGEISTIDEERWQSVTKAINPENHRARLEELKKKLGEEDKAVEATSEEPQVELASLQPAPTTTPTAERRRGPARLRLDAEKALRDRDFATAAEHYEALLEYLPPKDRAAGSVRLDLARLYLRHLDDRAGTVKHLRYFVQTWPDDAVTPQVLVELCRLVEDPAEEPHCRRR